MKLNLTLLILTLPLCSFAKVDNGPKTAEESSTCEAMKVEPCTEFRGRARSYMGRAETRIWKIGSNRLFAVREMSDHAKPELDKVNFHQDLFGTFRICPISRFEKGAMQDVCVASVTKSSTRPTGQ